ncbi:ribokinase [Caballeronia sordidicola]|uniref:Ribokinase n=1 Tax=Caballeronia sordidicola TaxID=196367 RepID=A0A242M8U0_CABSO|nr:ribokinase [Caballeronia sordidicola]OTP67104.1 Ribokinase [Caballeronia sordidicola]
MTRVFVVGNAVSDVTLNVRRAPRPGESILAQSIARAPGGKGLNQAVAAQRSGAKVVLVSAIGGDAAGIEIENALLREAFDDLRLIRLSCDTDVSILTVTADGENSIITTIGCTQASSAERLTASLSDVQAGDYVLMQGNLSLASTNAVADLARARSAKVVINAAPWHWDSTEALEKCDGVIANEGEILDIAKGVDVKDSAAWLQAKGPAWVIVTLGAEGCLLSTHEGASNFAARPVKASDTSGAGDVFSGVLVGSLARGASLDDAIQAGQRAAALTVERTGTFSAIPSVEEMQDIVR